MTKHLRWLIALVFAAALLAQERPAMPTGCTVVLYNVSGEIAWTSTNSFFEAYQQTNLAHFIVYEHRADGTTNRFHIWSSTGGSAENPLSVSGPNTELRHGAKTP